MMEWGRREGRTNEDRRKYKKREKGEKEEIKKKTRKDEEKKISLIYKSDSDEVFFARTIFIFI